MLYKVSLFFLFMQSALSFNKIFLPKIKTLETNKQLKIKNIQLFVQPNNNFDNIDNPDSTNEVNLNIDNEPFYFESDTLALTVAKWKAIRIRMGYSIHEYIRFRYVQTTKNFRASSYIPIPEIYKNSKCN